MFMKVPEEFITQVAAGEELVVSSVGHGRAKLCGQKVVIDIPGDNVKLGERFYATATNKIVRKLEMKDMVSPAKPITMVVGKKIKR